ncbi:phage tail repeat-like family [Trichomonas vaginalis G3]|uniref:phage tail repeat-like family n=1 Tax=Trichomonas vaginalis (strain ATCC PRA-98 / G3) TaxID=412133 RepID=UPI0021E5B6E9|nr:phage tail repeat-like family [Trichomonas vaginalis G3]KAI5546795.1 phage tail repeat-like family [Trichomonas vaginalis G3]
MIKQQQPQTITYATYAYNSKTAEQTQRLKYGDLEIVLKNDHFEFVCKGGAVISNIKEILFMNSKIKGITDDITSIPPEEQRYYALNAFPKVLKIGRFNLNEEFIKGFLNDIMKKADKTYVNDELGKKADKTYVNDELVKKADKEYVDEKDNEIIERVEWYHEWASKILKTKADTGWVSGCLDLKADKTYVNDELGKKADKTYVNDELVKKADKEYVDEKDNEIIERVEWYHEWASKILKTKADTGWVSGCLDLKADKTYVNDELGKKADKTYVNEIYQSLVGTKNIETIVGDVSIYEENKYFRWEFVQSLRNGIRYKLIPKNNNEMYVGYIKNNGTQVKVPLDNNCYLNLYGDEQKKYLRVYEMVDMTLPDPAPAPYYYDYGDDVRTPHVDEQKLTLYLDYYRYKRYNAIEKTRIVYYYTDDRNKYYSQDFTYPENIRLYYKKYSDTNQKKPEIVTLYFKFKRDNPIISHMFDLMNPVGSIYTSMDARGPQVMFGVGAWEQIVDRFLYCANSSKETGGSKTISGENLPAHSHYVNLSTSQAGWHKHRYWDWSGMTKGKGYDVKDDVKFAINCYWSDTQGEGNHTHFVSGYTQTTGQSKEYMPPFMTVFAWFRVA